MSWQPEWDQMQHLGDFATIGEALDRFYKPERLNREPDSRAWKIKHREESLAEDGWICFASHHDNVTGEGLWARKTDAGTIAIYRG